MKLTLFTETIHLIAAAAVALNMTDALTPAQLGEGLASDEFDRLQTALDNARTVPAGGADYKAQHRRLTAAATVFLLTVSEMGEAEYGALQHEAAQTELRNALAAFGITTAKDTILI